MSLEKNKYGASKQSYNGYNYDSALEKNYAVDLDWRVKAGDIKSWKRQQRIDLEAYGKHICKYYIDFVVTHNDGTKEYVEVKGFPTETWRLKWKMFEAKIKEQEPQSKMTIYGKGKVSKRFRA